MYVPGMYSMIWPKLELLEGPMVVDVVSKREVRLMGRSLSRSGGKERGEGGEAVKELLLQVLCGRARYGVQSSSSRMQLLVPSWWVEAVQLQTSDKLG